MALARRARARAPLVREKTLRGYSRIYTRRADTYFRGMMRRIEPGLRRALAPLVEEGTKADQALEEVVDLRLGIIDWNAETRVLSTLTKPVYVQVGKEAYDAVSAELGSLVSYDLNARPLRRVQAEIATRITRVTDTSREKIAAMAADGIRKGLSVEQIVRGVRPGTVNIRGPVPAFPGIGRLVDSWASTGIAARGILGSTAQGLTGSRAYLIAQTETANAFNRSALAAYQSGGLVDFVEVFDGPGCGWLFHADSDLAHGSIRTLEEAADHPLSHPRCQRSFGAALDATEAKPSPFASRKITEIPGATPGVAAISSRARALGEELAATARLAEPEITALLDRVRVQVGNAEFDGLDERLKKSIRIAEKAEADARMLKIELDSAVGGINDALRYTINIADDVYAANVRRALELLRAEGVEIVKLKNFWLESGYQGINTVLRTRSGVRFELQFGTPAQARTKVASHKLYEELRLLDPTSPRARAIEREIHELWQPIHRTRPPGIEGLTLESFTAPLRPARSLDLFEDPDFVAADRRLRELREQARADPKSVRNDTLVAAEAEFKRAVEAARARILASVEGLDDAAARAARLEVEAAIARVEEAIQAIKRNPDGSLRFNLTNAEAGTVFDLQTRIAELRKVDDALKARLPLEERILSRADAVRYGGSFRRINGQIYDEMLEVTKALEAAEELAGLRSAWSGRVSPRVEGARSAGEFSWLTRTVSITPKTLEYLPVERRHVFVHESLHSISRTSSNPHAYSALAGYEEGVVEMVARLIGPRLGARHFDAYSATVRDLEALREASGRTMADFYFTLIRTPIEQRRRQIELWLEEAGEIADVGVHAQRLDDLKTRR